MPAGCPQHVVEVERQQLLMGTIVIITAEGKNEESLHRAADAAFQEIARVEAMMSEWRPDSALSRFNRTAGQGPQQLPAELVDIFVRARAISRKTGGAFDITWAPLGEIWNFQATPFRPPAPEQIATAKKKVGYELLNLLPSLSDDEGAAELTRPGMKIGLGGIAKGYGIDRAIAILRAAGVPAALVNAGRDIRAYGRPASSRRPHWDVGVRDPFADNPDAILTRIAVTGDSALATSGAYEQYVAVDGARYHHILDPRTGAPSTGDVVSATVMAPDTTTADAYATGVFVLGVARGLAVCADDPALECLLIDTNGKRHATSGFPPLRPVR